MALDLLGSITRDRIVASVWMIGHRQIQVIEFAEGRLTQGLNRELWQIDERLAQLSCCEHERDLLRED
jgi:hypothetical protein